MGHVKKLVMTLALILSVSSAQAENIAVSCSNPNFPYIDYSMNFSKEGSMLQQGEFRICLRPPENPKGRCLMMHASIFTVDQSDNGSWHLNHLLGLELRQSPQWVLKINDLDIFRNLETDHPEILPEEGMTLNCQ